MTNPFPRLKLEKIRAVRQLALDLNLNEEAFSELDNALQYWLAKKSNERWLFVKISQEQFRYIVQAIHNCRNVATTLSVWNILITYMHMDTGEIVATRKQIAKDAITNVNEVSRALSELSKIGAIIRQRHGHKIAYFINPYIGWNGSEDTRQAASKTAPKLRLISYNEKITAD